MRRSIVTGVLLALVPVSLMAAAASAATTTTTTTTTSSTTTTVPLVCSGTTLPVTGTTLQPPPGCVPVLTTTTTSSTTTSSLPSAVTTVPEGCALPPTAQAVFVGTVQSVDEVSAVFAVEQVRAGSLEGYATDNVVRVRYGTDVKYLQKGSRYIVGAAPDGISLKLSSTVRDSAELFGGAEVAGSNRKCPVFEAAARTLHTDGSAIRTGIFVQLADQPWRLALALVAPPALVIGGLVALVWLRRGARPRRRSGR